MCVWLLDWVGSVCGPLGAGAPRAQHGKRGPLGLLLPPSGFVPLVSCHSLLWLSCSPPLAVALGNAKKSQAGAQGHMQTKNKAVQPREVPATRQQG